MIGEGCGYNNLLIIKSSDKFLFFLLFRLLMHALVPNNDDNRVRKIVLELMTNNQIKHSDVTCYLSHVKMIKIKIN